MLGRRPHAIPALLVAVVATTSLASCSGSSGESSSTTSAAAVARLSPAERATAVVACLREQGISARPLEDGSGVFLDTVGRDRAELQRLQAECESAVGADTEAVPLDDDEIRAVYDRWLTTAECLEQEGYEIDPAPSFETFLDSWVTGPWNPYLSVDASQEEFGRLNQLCPQ